MVMVDNNRPDITKVSHQTLLQQWGPYILFGLTSMLLCSFLPMALFAPVPLAIAFLIYGRIAGQILGLLGTVLFLLLCQFLGISLALSACYFFAAVYGALFAEIIFRNQDPAQGIVAYGLVIVATMMFLIVFVLPAFNVDVKALIVQAVENLLREIQENNSKIFEQKAGDHNTEMIKELLANPQQLAQQFINWVPAIMFVSVFLTFWAGLFLVLSNRHRWFRYRPYHFSIDALVKFKAPEYLVWLLISAMVMILAGRPLIGEWPELIGYNLLYCLGVFYLFQGFGIYLDLLSHLKIFGPFRTFLVVLTVLMGIRLLALIGLVDLWVNFRKFFKVNIDEGDRT